MIMMIFWNEQDEFLMPYETTAQQGEWVLPFNIWSPKSIYGHTENKCLINIFYIFILFNLLHGNISINSVTE